MMPRATFRLGRSRRVGACPAAIGVVCTLLTLSTASAAAAERCVLKSFAQLPVTMEGLRPVVVLKINGVDARFVVDSGAFYSMISPAAAAEFKLPTKAAPFGFYLNTVGGPTTVYIATVKTLTLAGYPISRVEFLVGGTEAGAGAVGVLGENLIRLADVEYDLAGGVLRFIRPEKCGDRPLAYWAAESQAVGVVDLKSPTPAQPQPRGSAFVNGTEIGVLFDTGAVRSVLSLSAAKRAGITPSTAGVTPAGSMGGFGRRIERVWIAPIDSFRIGGEEIKHTRILFGDLENPGVEMLLGEDFFLSHRIYVANGQRKLYFTYSGGGVFNLGTNPLVQSAAAPPSNAGGAAAPGATGSGSASSSTSSSSASAGDLGQFADEPTDAAGFMRRGAAYAARKDFEHALADLHRACELAPHEPDDFFELGRVEWQSGHGDLARQSFDQALALKPDHVRALFARASLTHSQGDLDTLDRVLAPEDPMRLSLGGMYEAAGAYNAAIRQFDLWIPLHQQDAQLAAALNARCLTQGQANLNLDRALKDCNAALHLLPRSAAILDSRGLVELRRGDLKRAIKDYDAALALRPRLSPSLYGRGLAKLRKGEQAEGHADLAAASAIDPKIAARFAGWGLVP